jgi:uncharacterized protein (DUF1330 family)
MKVQCTVALSMLAGAALGAVAVHSLHAQTKQPVYYVTEIDLANPDAYTKEYAPKAQAIIKAAGGRFLAAGKPTAIEGDPPKARLVVQVWDSMEKIQAWRNSAAFKELRPTADKYGAKFRSLAIEGMSQ